MRKAKDPELKSITQIARDYPALLKELLKHRSGLSEVEEKAFRGMLFRCQEAEKKGQVYVLNSKQKNWIKAVVKRLDIVEPTANLVSRGLVVRGAEVETPAVLRNLPLKPPGRA